uniref:Uncharacterized protein n=1 Tax=Megaselia scalaris TaxID=36166 RepID=T1GIZ6_MEGSC
SEKYNKEHFVNSLILPLFFNSIFIVGVYRATCVYLACKVEEFNISIKQFSENIKGDREKAEDIILSNELLLMQHLNYYLTVHNPFRPVEGLLIDIKKFD